MDPTSFLAIAMPLLIAGIGLIAPILKTIIDRKKPDAEALQIYDSIEVANAKAAQETIHELRAEIKRLRTLLRYYGHNPDDSISGPLQEKKE